MVIYVFNEYKFLVFWLLKSKKMEKKEEEEKRRETSPTRTHTF